MESNQPRESSWTLRYTRIVVKLISPLVALLYSNFQSDNVWVFGAWEGKSFSDNSKYLYLYTRENTDIRPVWITKSTEVEQSLSREGVEVYHAYSLLGAILSAQARYVFITHSIKDVNEFSIIFSKVVQLTHGVPIKQIGWDQQRPFKRRLIKHARDYIWGDYYRVFVSSKRLRAAFASAYRCDIGRVIASGYPRNDVIRTPSQFTHPLVREPLSLPTGPDEKLLVYLPTFRGFTQSAFHDFIDFSVVDDILESTNSKLIIKPHPASSPPSVTGLSNVFIIKTNIDLYPYFTEFDALISDYSSIAPDFAILKRPILHYLYDLEDYRLNRGFYFELEEILPGTTVESPEEVYKWIQRTATDADEPRDIHMKTPFVIYGENACENIITHLHDSE